MSDQQTSTLLGVQEAITAVMRDIGAIGKNKRNEAQKFDFRGIDDVLNALHGPLCEHGLVIMPTVLEREGETRQTGSGGSMNVVHLTVEFKFIGPAGDHLSAVVVSEAQDSGDKATNKAMSAAYKYMALQVFCIPTKDMEEQDASHEPASPQRAPQRPTAPNPARPLPTGVVINPGAVLEARAEMAPKLSMIKSLQEQLGWKPGQVRELAIARGLPGNSGEYTIAQADELIAALDEKLGELAA
jgi:hypothetical protein